MNLRVGRRDHTIAISRRNFRRGVTFEAPRQSLVTALKYEIFDDLLIGNFMKTTLHGKWPESRLYPEFSPYVAKYADNGQARTQEELRAYFAEYRRRTQAPSLSCATASPPGSRKCCAQRLNSIHPPGDWLAARTGCSGPRVEGAPSAGYRGRSRTGGPQDHCSLAPSLYRRHRSTRRNRRLVRSDYASPAQRSTAVNRLDRRSYSPRAAGKDTESYTELFRVRQTPVGQRVRASIE